MSGIPIVPMKKQVKFDKERQNDGQKFLKYPVKNINKYEHVNAQKLLTRSQKVLIINLDDIGWEKIDVQSDID